ncbi:MAG: c-type cytochrome [Ktedonobacteraceae bacterium]|nr:c-type cytochrome [Ktedonobacteraceae bacterium]
MIDPIQAAVGIIALLVTVGALLYVFYSRTNAVEKTGYGALTMLALISLLIPVFWIMENNGQAMAKAQQHTLDLSRGAKLYAQYCFQCHGTKGQGRVGTGPNVGSKLNNNPAVNNLSDNDLIRIIGGGVYNTDKNHLDQAMMRAWSQQYGGPLTDNDIQYLFTLIRSSDPNYLSKNGYASGNGFTQVPDLIQQANPSTYQTAVAGETANQNPQQFGKTVDMTGKSAVTINMVTATTSASCQPACYDPINIKVKVGTTITWVNKDTQGHTVTAIVGTDPNTKKVAPNIFDSGIGTPIKTNATYTYKVTMAAYNLNKDHTVLYYCQYHPTMVAILTIVP